MVVANGENPWKALIVVALLAFFFCLGVAHMLQPDRFLKRSGVRKGGEMLTDFNRMGFRVIGAAFAALSGYAIYVLVGDLLGR